MKTTLVLILCISSIKMIYAQEIDGVVSLNIPVRNSLTFNRYTINPTFSFVREQTKYISFYNKREWSQFDNAPLTYLASYSGRQSENIGAGLSVFQQNYGVLTTFGSTLNFAYNTQLTSDSNLTFGLNISVYKSGINIGNVITNFDDPSLQNVPENFLLSINPGINYGTDFFDFGISLNNLVLYNFESSTTIKDNPQQGIQAHIMYTGYMQNSRGFLDESKFTGLIKSEFNKDDTTLSAIAMLSVPKGIWAQIGYNTHYGVSGGLGINISSQIALEYNYERGIGDLTNFGPSHDFTLAYRFKNNNRYNYSSGDEVNGLLISEKKRKPVIVKIDKEKAEANRKSSAERKANAKAKLLAEQKAKEEAEVQRLARLERDEINAKAIAEQKVREDAEAQAKLLAEQKAKQEAEAQRLARLEREENNAKAIAEQKAREDAEAQTKLLAEQKAKQEAEIQARLLIEQKAKQEAEAQARLMTEQKAKQEAEAQARLMTEQKAIQEAEIQAKLLAEQKVAEAEKNIISNPKDQLGKDMQKITQEAENSKTTQANLLDAYDAIIQIKDNDLKDLKEENDLSEKGITVAPKPFKSITEENNRLKNIESELDDVINDRNKKIKELKKLYDDNFEADTITNDEVYLFYQKTLKRLESEQLDAIEIKSNLKIRLADIKVATEFERRRRIKRAAFDNEEERYNNDRATLLNMQRNTPLASQPYSIEDFDFGEEQSNNIQILKNVNHVEDGYYMIIAVHSDIEKRNEFVKKVIESGRVTIDFFYDVKTTKYFIYYDRFESINEATNALKSKGDRVYNTKMSIIKIEN